MNTRIRVTAMYVIETGTTNDMVSRAFTSHIDNTKMAQVAESTRGGEMVQSANLAGIAGTIIMPSAQVDRLVNIAGGWQNKRYRFVMHAVPDVGGLDSSIQYIYTGYTNATGVVPTATGYDFAPDMQLFINNRIVISAVAPNSLNTNGFYNVQNASHVIHPGTLGGLAKPSFDPANLAPLQVPSTMRPTDLMHSLSSKETSGFNERFVGDMRSAVTLALSRRTNQLPANYLATSLDALHRAIQTEDPNQHTHGIYSSAAANASEILVYEDPLIGMISMNRTGYTETGYVRWDEIKTVLPELTQHGVVQVIGGRDTKKMDIYQSSHGDYQSWYTQSMSTGTVNVDQSMEAIVATYLMQTVPAIAIQSLMSRVSLRATNMTPDGSIKVEVDPPVPLFGSLPVGYIQQAVQSFVTNLEVNVLRDMPINKMIPFSLAMHLDSFGDSHIQISVNGQPPVPYCSPTYADASFTPIVTSNHQNLHGIANDVSYLASNLGVYNPHH